MGLQFRRKEIMSLPVGYLKFYVLIEYYSIMFSLWGSCHKHAALERLEI